MGTKENIEFLKEELSSEEKFLEQIVRAEKFYKKYKKQLITVLVVFIVGIISYVGYDIKKDHDLKVSNEAYMKLLSNPKDSESLKILKEKNPTLFYVYQFRKAIEKNDIKKLEEISSKNIPIISNIAKYQISALKKDEKLLNSYTMDQKSLYKDLALLDEAYLLYTKSRIKEAKTKLKTINKDSFVYPYANFLLHYGLKAE
ncbi:hypothetical protein [Nitrosophilus kaiyonis]|uniref:hypothetical protein n=1 Tax=Nitrosophilus kaiyonis TaxID=2930200 RepID=UPI00249294D5|nr:hypothetical protein [Nitrosophilus kaiyonis]